MATFSIAASLDDNFSRETLDPSPNFPTYDFVWFGNKGDVAYRGYLRFSIDILKGSTITDAKLTFHAYGATNGAFTAKIGLLDFDSCPEFKDETDPWDMAVTDDPAEVDYPPTDPWVDNTDYDSPEIKTLVQGFIDRGGYSVDNYIGLRLDYNDASKNDYRAFDSKDLTGGTVAVLTVNYTPPSAYTPKVIMIQCSPMAKKNGIYRRLKNLWVPRKKLWLPTPPVCVPRGIMVQ